MSGRDDSDEAKSRDVAPFRTEGVLETSKSTRCISPLLSDDLAFCNGYSIFHSDWWLEAATGGKWGKSEVRQDGKLIGSWPFLVKRRLGIEVSTQPIMTRSLGPVVIKGHGKPIVEFRREGEIIQELVARLPRVRYFAQTLDPRTTVGIHIKNAGFTCVLDYSFRIPAGQRSAQLWDNMRDKTRNLIRSAQGSGISVAEISDINEFLAFYESRLKSRGVRNVYTSASMRRICISAIEHSSGKAIGAYSSSGALIAAILVVWDFGNSYYLLSSRIPEAHSGAVSLLLWHGIQEAAANGRGFDFDGTPTPGIVRFLSGFSASFVPRIQVIRGGAFMRLAHATSRRMASKSMFGEVCDTDVWFE